MCVVSMIYDYYSDKWRDKWNINYPNYPWPNVPFPSPIFDRTLPPYGSYPYTTPGFVPLITKEEIEEFRKLLDRAREYDKKNGEPNCELDEKKESLKKIAKAMGVEIDFV